MRLPALDILYAGLDTSFPSFRFSELSSPSGVLLPLAEKGTLMPVEAILHEVNQLNLASDRIEGLAEHHPPVAEALITIAGNVRSAATLLAILVETRLRSDGDVATRTKPI